MSTFLDHLQRRVLVLDGGMGTSTHKHHLSVETDYAGCENCTDILCRTRPDLIESIHRSFLEAGADAIETNSFGGAAHVLNEFDLAGECFELSKRSAEIARAAADAFSTPDKPRFVLGSMGPGTKLITLGQITWEAMLASYREAMRGLIAGGADTILIETCQDLLQIKCAINAALGALEDSGKTVDDIPIMVSVTIEQTGTMLVGSSLEAAVAALRHYPITSIGLNCATGPTEMGESIKFLDRSWDRAITCFPNAGLPALQDGETVYPLGPEPLAEALKKFVGDHGVRLVGGCCGTTPEHIGAIARAVEGVEPRRSKKAGWVAASTSLFSPVPHRQDTSFLFIGERCNASGSRKFKGLLEAEDWDSIVSLAREQVRDGSHVLDVNVDYAGRDNPRDMAEIVSRLSRQVDAPLMIDSTQVKTTDAGLRHAAGRCIINSANFEDGEGKFDEICKLARAYNAALVIGTIDEDPEAAMARTAERKLSIAERAIGRATTVHGLEVADLFMDPLVLPISTGMDSDRRSALELIEGTRRIAAKFPQVQLTCGLSNVSFGLKPAARVVLNSVLMHELVEAGMTSAIVHASKILPLNKIDGEQRAAALDLIYDRRAESAGGTGLPEGVTDEAFDPLARLIDLFKDVEGVAAAKKERKNLTLEERLREHIIDGEKERLHVSLDEAMAKYAPLDIINDHLLDGMKTVGELFGAGEMQLPFVLQSAEVMKKAVAYLEPHMEKIEGQTKGTIVLATVKGDVHDIGKNLVDIILTNNGYTVHNIGIKQTIDNILKAFEEYSPHAIGLSGLLVKSVNVMEENIETLNERGLTPPLILGGAALARSYAEGYLRDKYKGPLLYGKDAFDGLRIMDHIVGGRLGVLADEIDERQGKRRDVREKAGLEPEQPGDSRSAMPRAGGAVAVATRSELRRDVEVPVAPFLGSRVVEGLDLNDIYPYINPVALFRVQWQYKRGKRTAEEYDRELETKARPIFEELKARCRSEKLLQPRVVYGYYPVCSDGNDLVVFDSDDHDREIERFTFPRQQANRRLCISDFFKDADECRSLGRMDVLGLSCVTMGPRISAVCRSLFESDDYSAYLYMHGMGVETAEALAELWHKRMRQELAIAGDDSPDITKLFAQHYQGSRYSFGYPACPEMSDQEKLWRLIDPTRIGCELTENWQIDPEQSTSAIVVHHPEAKYFNA
ncbi:MAG: methionine synthase [Phycisphaeraceae bacterium]|nr:MAG: methionine synthase [Phycisphaeraceae bacterium]